MYTGLQHLHSYLAYLVIAGLVIAILGSIMSSSGNKPFSDSNRKLGLLGLIPAHLQWVVGLILYFVSPLGMSNFSGENMKNSEFRLYMLEHPLIMLIAVILITIGYSKAKKSIGHNKGFRHIYIFYSIALILILSRIPWGAWPGN